MEDKSLFYSSNATDIFYWTGEKVWKEKLFIYQGNGVLLTEEEIINYLKGVSYTKVVTDFAKLTHKEFLQLQKWVGKHPIENGNLITKKRAIKTSEEIEALRKSALLNQEGFKHIYPLLKEGVSEKEIAWAFELFVREQGASALAFEPIVAFADGTAFPHHRASDRKLKRGDAITLDLGVMLDGFASDCTRSFFFKDEGDTKFEMLVQEAYNIAIEMCRPGGDFVEIQKSVDQFFKDNGVFQFRKHTIGHGVGLEVHEHPFIWSDDTILKEGMVITIEPGLYKVGHMGYRYENTLVITKEGCESL